MKRAVIAVLIGGAVFAGIYGFAASLGVTSDTLGSGNAVVAACQATPVNVSYASAYSAAAPGYQATTVTVSGLAAGCQGGKAIKVTLIDSGNASLGEQTGVTPSASSQALTFSGVSAAAVTGVHVTIAG